MKNKSLNLVKQGTHNSTGWLRAMRESSDREDRTFKSVRRLRKRFDQLDDWDWGCTTSRWLYKNFRNWKVHSKCRHQWDRHEFPVIEYSTGICFDSRLAEDHNRKWVLECLRLKKTCAFNTHNDDSLYNVLISLYEDGICSLPHNLQNGVFEVTLLKQVAKQPHRKNSLGDKGTKGKYLRRNRQHNRRINCRKAMDAVAERIRRVSRKGSEGVALAPLPIEFFVPSLSANIKSESQNIVAAIIRVNMHHCSIGLTVTLLREIPKYFNLFDERDREIIRKFVKWLDVLPVLPTRERILEFLDFFSYNRLLYDQIFKNHTCLDVEQLIQECHD